MSRDAFRVHRAGPGDESEVRDVRLRALHDSPGDFDITREATLGWSHEVWTRWIADGATFLLRTPAGPAGLAGGARHWHDPRGVFLLAVWVDPACRGTGAAHALVTAVIDWSRDLGARDVWLHVVKENARARRFYERLGFRLTGAEVLRERDGVTEVEMRLRLGVSKDPDAESETGTG